MAVQQLGTRGIERGGRTGVENGTAAGDAIGRHLAHADDDGFLSHAAGTGPLTPNAATAARGGVA